MAPSPTTINFPPNVHFLPFSKPPARNRFWRKARNRRGWCRLRRSISHHEEAKRSSAQEGEAPDWHLSAWEKQSAQGQGRCCLNSPLAGEEEEATPICRIIFKNSKRKHEQYSRHQTSSADSDRSKRISSEDRIKNNRRWAGLHSSENRNMQPEKNN